MKAHLVSIILISLLITGTAVADCVGYQDEFDARVLDALYRPVPGAMVQITFDRGNSFGDQYFTTPLRKANENGTYHFLISNQGTTTRTIDCNIVLFASYGPANGTASVIALEHDDLVDVVIPVYKVGFLVRDQMKRPLTNASVYFFGETKTTGNDGLVSFNSPTGKWDYFVTYKGGKEGAQITVANDMTQEIVIPVYQVSLTIRDENGALLPANITYLNNTANAPGGMANITIYQTEGIIAISHGDIKKIIVLVPKYERSEQTVYMDVTAPQLLNITQTMINNRLRLVLDINDIGEKSSALDASSIKAKYRLPPSTSWQTLNAYALPKGKYGIDFPEFPDGQLVEFVITAKDYSGNTAEQTGQFTIKAAAQPDPIQPQNQTNQTVSPQPQNTDIMQQIPWLYVIGGLLVVIIIAVVAMKLLKKPDEKKEEPVETDRKLYK